MRVVLSLAAAALLASAVPASPQSTKDEAIIKVADAYRQASLANDPKAVVALYADDAVEMPPNRPALKGKAEIQKYYETDMGGAMKLKSLEFDHMDARTSGDIGYDVGTFKQTVAMADGKTMSDTGKYLVLLKKVGNDWKMTYVIYNSDKMPMMPPGMMPKPGTKMGPKMKKPATQ